MNPFSTKHWIPGRIPYYFDDGTDLDSLLARVRSQPGMFQIVGSHGSGKSTLMESLARRYRELGVETRQVTLNDHQRELTDSFALSPCFVFLLDGFEQMSLVERWRLRLLPWHKTEGLILTTHRPAWRIPILHHTTVRFERFRELVFRLLENSSISFDDKTLRSVFQRAGGNVRMAFFELYDRVSEPCDPPDF